MAFASGGRGLTFLLLIRLPKQCLLEGSGVGASNNLFVEKIGGFSASICGVCFKIAFWLWLIFLGLTVLQGMS